MSNVNYNRILTTTVPREQLIASIVQSIQGVPKGYVVTTDWKSWVIVKHTTSNKKQWALAAVLLLLLDFIFFWTSQNEATVGMDFDATTEGTRVRITGVASGELIAHIENLVGTASAQHVESNPGLAYLKAVQSPMGHLVIESRNAGAASTSDDEDEAASPAGRSRAACFQCECQDFVAALKHDTCTCGHSGSKAHTLICLPERPIESTDWSGVTVLPGRVMIAGGLLDGQPTDTCLMYKAADNAWSRVAPVPEPCFGGVMVRWTNDRLVLLGAESRSADVLEPITYDAANDEWTALPPMKAPRRRPAAAIDAAGSIVVSGGRDDNGDPCGASEVYSAASGAWRQRPEMPTPRFDALAIGLDDGRTLVVGGHDGQGYLPTMELFAPSSGEWTAGPEMPIPLARAVGGIVSGCVGVTGGVNAIDTQGVDTLLMYVIAQNRWMAVDPTAFRLRPARYGRRPVSADTLVYMVR